MKQEHRFIQVGDIVGLSNYMTERHSIYLKRKRGEPGPWTQDPILQQYRFCNIFRELDTVTQYIDQHIRKPYANHPNLWIMLAIARYINWPETLQTLIDLAENQNVPCWPSHPKFDCGGHLFNASPEARHSDLAWALAQMAKEGRKVYTGAYMIRAESDPKKPWYSWKKHEYIADIVIGRLWEDRAKWTHMLEDVPAQLRSFNTAQQVHQFFCDKRYVGWGPFMSYEVVTDMMHTRYLKHAPDRFSWANAGPGAIRGLNRLTGDKLTLNPGTFTTNEEMKDILNILNHHRQLLSPAFNEVFEGHTFEMRDVEHTLCEFDKYERVRLGEGKPRSRYDWKQATLLNKE